MSEAAQVKEVVCKFRTHEPHARQQEFLLSTAKRKVVKAGRRGGKTEGLGIDAVEDFVNGHRVLYAAPTSDQLGRFWSVVTRALQEPIDKKLLYKNESEHIIEVRNTENRIRAKTAWNADTLRGDYADKLKLDEFQLMNEDTWGVVGAPMLLDNNGDCTFAYTPPALHSRSVSKADDPQHAAKLYKRAQQLALIHPERWATFHFTSMDNPHLSKKALSEITQDMTALAYRMEILAEDVDEAPGSLWKRKQLEDDRAIVHPALDKIVVAVDPTVSEDGAGDACGIIGAGIKGKHGYTLADKTMNGSPLAWATEAVNLYKGLEANLIVAEKNNGGEMVRMTIHQVDANIPVKLVHASRGKIVRAEPVSAKYEQHLVHHVGAFPALEDELCLWLPGDKSPNRLDALVWAYAELMNINFFSDIVIKDFPE